MVQNDKKSVSLRRRVLVWLSLTVLVLLVLFAWLAQGILTSGFKRIEQVRVQDELQRLDALFEQRCAELNQTTFALAARDDVRRFLSEPLNGQPSTVGQLPLASDDIRALRVDSVLIYNALGELAHVVTHEKQRYQEEALIEQVSLFLRSDQGHLARNAIGQARHALIRLDNKPLFLSTCSVLDQDKQSGDKRQLGTVILLRWLDPAWNEEFNQAAQQIVNFIWRDQINNEKNGDQEQPLNKAQLRMVQQVQDSELFLQVTLERNAAKQGQQTYYMLIVALVCVGMVLILVLTLNLDMHVIRRVSRLQQRLSEISQTNDPKGLVDELPSDEIGQLGSEINHLLAKQRGWREKIVNRNAAMSLIFNNLPIGILSLDMNGKIQSEFSSACHEIFGRVDLEGLVFSELIAPGEANLVIRRQLIDYLLLVRGGTVSPEALEEINPLKAVQLNSLSGPIIIGCRFYRIDERGKNTTRLFRVTNEPPVVVNSILVTLTDITDQHRLMEEVARSQADYEQLKSMAEDVELFHSFITAGRRVNNDLTALVSSLGDAEDKVRLIDMQRLVNLLVQGGEAFALTALHKSSKQFANELTTALGMAHVGESEVRRFRYVVADIEGAINQTEKQFRTLLGLGVENDAIRSLGVVRQESAHVTLEELRERKRQILLNMEGNKRELARIGLAPVIRSVPKMAARRGVEIHFSIAGEDTPIELHTLEVLNQVLPHLFRFAFDHGLDKPDDRRMAHKLEAFDLSLTCERTSHNITLRLTDDGKGIDPQLMRRMAVEQKMFTEEQVRSLSDADAQNLIFSLMHEAGNGSESGVRYMGLNLIVARLHDELKATIRVEARAQVGTSMVISIPLR
jgi:chemotaxis protein histidine kinase CheA